MASALRIPITSILTSHVRYRERNDRSDFYRYLLSFLFLVFFLFFYLNELIKLSSFFLLKTKKKEKRKMKETRWNMKIRDDRVRCWFEIHKIKEEFKEKISKDLVAGVKLFPPWHCSQGPTRCTFVREHELGVPIDGDIVRDYESVILIALEWRSYETSGRVERARKREGE